MTKKVRGEHTLCDVNEARGVTWHGDVTYDYFKRK